jgi:hypothetical protein
MKIGQKVEIERLPNGLYKITQPDGTQLVGAAPSTIIALSHAIFHEEAQWHRDAASKWSYIGKEGTERQRNLDKLVTENKEFLLYELRVERDAKYAETTVPPIAVKAYQHLKNPP